MAQKPRTTRSKRAKPNGASPSKPSPDSAEPSYFTTALNAVSSLSIPQKIGLGVSAVALLSTAAISLSSSKSGKKGKQPTKGGPMKRGTKGGFDDTPTPWSPPKRSKTRKGTKGKGKGGANGIEMIPTAQITKAFQTCLAAKRPQQQLMADQFFSELKTWSSEQVEVDGQTILVNFLFWYYRSMNVPETRFHSEQAEHIRYWADYPLTDDLKWDFFNIKFDYLYSTALLQKSIPHMRRFYKWIQTVPPRPTPESASSRKPNYLLTKYQAACILGDWEGVKTIGAQIEALSKTATSATAPRNDYMMHYTLRALELPTSNPNFGLMVKMVDKLQSEFDPLTVSPPIFAEWRMLSFRYRNRALDAPAGTSTYSLSQGWVADQDFVFASDKILGDDGWYTFYPQQSALNQRISKKVCLWGRVAQLVSPVLGAAGFLPLTGSWSDTKLHLATNWTFRGGENRLTRKHVVLSAERTPKEKGVQSKDYFGKAKEQKGYVWRGTLKVYRKRLDKNTTIRSLYDQEGGDYFDGERGGDDVECMEYELELVINKDEEKKGMTDKDLKNRILEAMSGANGAPAQTRKGAGDTPR